MTVHEISDIVRKNPLIAYRREYSGSASFTFLNKNARVAKIEFSLELTALGQSIIKVKILDSLEFPTLQLINILKDMVQALDKSGVLP